MPCLISNRRSLSSPGGQRTYDHAIDEFVHWYCSEPRLAFNRTVVLRYRRHRLSCSHKSERYRRCQCPIYVEGSLLGEPVRKALDLVSWEAASDLVTKWNASGQVGVVRIEVPAIAEAIVKHIADAEARNLQPDSVKKIRDVIERRFLGKG